MSFDIGSILKPVIPAPPGPYEAAVTVHRLGGDDDNDTTTQPENPMGTNTAKTQPRVLAALKTHGSLTREKLASITGLTALQISSAIFNAKKAGAITVTGPRKNGVVSLAKQPGSGTTAKPAKAKPLKLAVESTSGADNPTAGIKFAQRLFETGDTPAPVRAIATAAAGAILIRGTTVVAELDRAECAAVRELFCP